jgi:hypothetical protein
MQLYTNLKKFAAAPRLPSKKQIKCDQKTTNVPLYVISSLHIYPRLQSGY